MNKNLLIFIISILLSPMGMLWIVSPSITASVLTQSQPLDNMTKPIGQAQTRFGFKLLNQLIQTEENQNVFISPTSIILALSMLYNGAGGSTKQEIANTLEYQGLSLDSINQANQVLQQQLNQATPQVQLAIANALWLREGFSIESEFLKTNQQFYQAEVAELDFDSADTPKTMNRWVQEKTQGKINQIIDQIQPNDVMFLINAIYFKGEWTNAFKERRTQGKEFFRVDGTEKQHPLMSQQNRFPYLENSQFQAINLPYGEDKRFSLYVFLPKEEARLDEFLKTITLENWTQWMQQFSVQEGRIELPRFQLEYGVDLNNILEKLGMISSFNPNQADFSKLSSADIFVSSVKHKTFLEVNEEGTEAAASTSIGITTTSIKPLAFEMVINRPFFCAIRDNKTETLLFMGVIYDPKI